MTERELDNFVAFLRDHIDLPLAQLSLEAVTHLRDQRNQLFAIKMLENREAAEKILPTASDQMDLDF